MPDTMFMKERMLITGGHALQGTVHISGGKNTAVAVIPATLLCDEPCTIENLPDISDVHALVDILCSLGAKVDYEPNRFMTVDPRPAEGWQVSYRDSQRLRASYYLLGALLGRRGQAEVYQPGGCEIGSRPIDQHLKGFRMLGANVEQMGGRIKAKADVLTGTDVVFDCVSVGATINVMLAAAKAHGTTIIYNAAKEPHIVDLANFLNSMGANIKGAGTDTIRIFGVDKLHGGTYAIIPDQIEAGTYMVAAAATRGNVLVKNVIPKHLESITAKLAKIGVNLEEYDDSVRISVDGPLVKTSVKTMPPPGFPTDMQPQISTLLCLAEGTSIVTDEIFNNRFRYVDELRRMGADISVSGNQAIIRGGKTLKGTQVQAGDLRGGAALLIAALMAEGETCVTGAGFISRGYEHICEDLRTLGCRIWQPGTEDLRIYERK